MIKNNIYKILIVDDDPILCQIAEKKILQHGYQVVSAKSGKEGLLCVDKDYPDFLLLDYELPDMSGVDVCHHIRNSAISKDIPILFITGKEDYQSIENAFQAGATDFFCKPINWSLLIYRIQYMLRGHTTYLSLMSTQNRLSKAQKIAKITNWDYSSTDKLFKWSDTIYDILDIEPQQQKNFSLNNFLERIPNEDIEAVRMTLENCLDKHISFKLEHGLIITENNIKTISHLGTVIKNDVNGTVDCIGTLQDITEQRNNENQIRKLAFYDSLTGLKNRESFLTTLSSTLKNNENSNLLSALLFIDLDDFKSVNDTLGHSIGDSLLCMVAERLRICIRNAEQDKEYEVKNHNLQRRSIPDTMFRINSIDTNRFDLGRLGGDEFTIFIADIHTKEVAASIAKRLFHSLKKPFHLDEHKLFVTFSIGIAISPDDGNNIETLLQNADIAMYSAKANGKNNFQFYEKELRERSINRLSLESDLRNAIANNELYIVYQPQLHMKTGELIGAEALMRWKHKTKGDISPAVFIPVAEETGQILPITAWLFEQIKNDLLAWKKQSLIPENFKLAINICSLEIRQLNFINKVISFFSDFELNKHIQFELTESVMMTNAASNLEKLTELEEQHITLSIDDFGTGYSSLSYLYRFPVHTIKIDRSFISNMENDDQVNIVKAIIAMAHNMGIIVVAEGIENQWQYDFLKAEECDVAQGFFLFRPMSLGLFQKFLTNDFQMMLNRPIGSETNSQSTLN